MPATDRYALIVESQSRGDQEIVRFENALNRAGESAERQGQRFRRFSEEAQIAGRSVEDYGKSIAKSVAELYLLEKAGERAISVAVQGARAYAENRSATERLVDTYRALRIGIASTEGAMAALTAAGTVGLGILIERTLSLANAQAKLYEANAFAAARSPNRSFQAIQSGQYLDRISGQSVSQYFPDPNSSVETIKQFEAMRDPLERIKFAVDNFGADAEKVFPLLNRRIRENIDSAQDLARTLDTDTRRSIAAFRQDVDAFSQVFDGVGDSYRRLKEELKQGITIRVSAAFDFTRTLARRLPELPGEEAGTTTDRPSNAGDTIFSVSDLLREAERDLLRSGSTSAPSRIAPPSRPAADPRMIASARSSIAARLQTESGVREALGEERRRLSTLQDYFTYNPDKRGDVALPLLQAAETVKRLEEKLKSFDTSGAEKAARQAAQVVEIIAGIGERTPVENLRYQRLRVLSNLADNNARPAQMTQADALLQGQIAAKIIEEQAPSLARLRTRNLMQFSITDRYVTNAAFEGFAQDQLGSTAARRSSLMAAGAAESIRDAERRATLTRQQAEFEERRIRLMTGPGGEVLALERGVQLRLQAIDAAVQMGSLIDAQAEKTKVLQDRELALLEIQNRRKENFRNAVERGFDAAVAGGSGIRSFLTAQVLGVGRTVAGNLGGELFSGASGRFTIPGQANADGSPNFLGKLLANTPFAADPLKTATDRNTEATNLNTAALMGRAGATSVGGGALSTITSALGIPAGVFTGASSSNPYIFSAASRNALPGYTGTAADAAVNRAINDQIGIKTPVSAGSSAALKGVGVAGIVAGSAFGAYSGFKAGGAQGALQGSSSILGGVGATLAMLAPESGPLAPILLGASLATGLVAALLGDPKKRRDREINSLIDSARYVSNAPMAYDMDMFGRGIDTDISGSYRTMPPIVVQVQAMDSKSFVDHASDISDAVQVAIQQGHGVTQAAREAILGGNV